MRKIVVGSRQSELALVQTYGVVEQLKKIAGDRYDFSVKKIVTKGDRILDVTLNKVGGKGLFVKEIEQAMLDGEIDLAVHSMKDMPAILPPGLTIGAVPEREDPRDVLISKTGDTLEQLPQGAVVGTSSLRRSAQIKAARPDLNIKWIRGNVGTRLRKLREEDYDAIILAAAGMKRLNLDEDTITQYLAVDMCIPAVGQGALAIESREDDEEILDLLSQINNPATRYTVEAERAFLHALEGGCQVPIGGFARLNNGSEKEGGMTLTGFVADPDGATFLKHTLSGSDPQALGKELAEHLISQGAQQILEKVKEANQE